jgi:hypothetical protein
MNGKKSGFSCQYASSAITHARATLAALQHAVHTRKRHGPACGIGSSPTRKRRRHSPLRKDANKPTADHEEHVGFDSTEALPAEAAAISGGQLAIFRPGSHREFLDWNSVWYPVQVQDQADDSDEVTVKLLGPKNHQSPLQEQLWALAWETSEGKEIYRQTERAGHSDTPVIRDVPSALLSFCGFQASNGCWGLLPRALLQALPPRN